MTFIRLQSWKVEAPGLEYGSDDRVGVLKPPLGHKHCPFARVTLKILHRNEAADQAIARWGKKGWRRGVQLGFVDKDREPSRAPRCRREGRDEERARTQGEGHECPKRGRVVKA